MAEDLSMWQAAGEKGALRAEKFVAEDASAIMDLLEQGVLGAEKFGETGDSDIWSRAFLCPGNGTEKEVD